MTLPKDPIILLSYINTQLRDNYSSLNDFVASNNVNKSDLLSKMESINYFYDKQENRFK